MQYIIPTSKQLPNTWWVAARSHFQCQALGMCLQMIATPYDHLTAPMWEIQVLQCFRWASKYPVCRKRWNENRYKITTRIDCAQYSFAICAAIASGGRGRTLSNGTQFSLDFSDATSMWKLLQLLDCMYLSLSYFFSCLRKAFGNPHTPPNHSSIIPTCQKHLVRFQAWLHLLKDSCNLFIKHVGNINFTRDSQFPCSHRSPRCRHWCVVLLNAENFDPTAPDGRDSWPGSELFSSDSHRFPRI